MWGFFLCRKLLRKLLLLHTTEQKDCIWKCGGSHVVFNKSRKGFFTTFFPLFFHPLLPCSHPSRIVRLSVLWARTSVHPYCLADLFCAVFLYRVVMFYRHAYDRLLYSFPYYLFTSSLSKLCHTAPLNRLARKEIKWNTTVTVPERHYGFKYFR